MPDAYRSDSKDLWWGWRLAIVWLLFPRVVLAAHAPSFSIHIRPILADKGFAVASRMIPPGRPTCGSIRSKGFAPPLRVETLPRAKPGSD
jgi:hypothetical protein